MKNSHISLAVFVVAFFLSVAGRAQLYVDPDLADRIETSSLRYHIDDSGSMTYDDLDHMTFNDSIDAAYDALMKLNPRRKVWLTFELTAKDTLTETLGFSMALWSRADIFVSHHDGTDTAHVGLSDIGHVYTPSRDVQVVEIPLSIGEKVRITASLTNYHRFTQISSIYVQLWPVSAFEAEYRSGRPSRRPQAYLYIFFCGLLIFQMVYILLQWFLVRRREYAYYVFYTMAVFFYFYGRMSVFYAETPAIALIDAEMLYRINDIHALIRIARQRRTVAWFLVAGSACAMVAHLLANIVPFLPLAWLVAAPVTITMVGIFLELLIFNTGLLFKAKETESEKVEAQKAHIRELKMVQKLREDNLRVRDEISSDLHDDIGSTLSSIGIYNFAARQKLEKGDKAQTRELLTNIEKSANDAMNAMSDLVWSTNPKNDSTDKLVERIREFAFEVLKARGCRFSTEVHPSFYELSLNHVERKNILLILKEAVNNTAKYAQATTARLEIKPGEEGRFIFEFEDNGIGFDTSVKNGNGNGSGNGMRTMRSRAAELSDYFETASRPGSTRICFGLRPAGG
ncbi:MAG: histidine kinase [Flavobacteriales bacterium]|nr:histidine kinase [Flavobacteriales bacterium]